MKTLELSDDEICMVASYLRLCSKFISQFFESSPDHKLALHTTMQDLRKKYPEETFDEEIIKYKIIQDQMITVRDVIKRLEEQL